MKTPLLNELERSRREAAVIRDGLSQRSQRTLPSRGASPWRACRALALLGVAALLVGCPPATGRHRGPTYDGGWGPPPPWDSGTGWGPDAGDPCAFIVPEGYCEPSSEGLSCLAMVPCERTTAYTECTCSRSTWVCAPLMCGGTDDGGVEPPPMCPPGAMVVAGGACDMRYEGLFCGGGEVMDCDGSRRALSCACVSGQWYCDTPSCGGP